jgi:hypothetical protein
MQIPYRRSKGESKQWQPKRCNGFDFIQSEGYNSPPGGTFGLGNTFRSLLMAVVAAAVVKQLGLIGKKSIRPK